MGKYFFLDRGILVGYHMSNARIELNKLQKDTCNNPLFGEGFFEEPPLPWEIRYDNGYPNIIYDPVYQIYRCYYTCITYDESAAGTPLAERGKTDYKPKENRIASLCYAESRDGIHFVKPELGLTEYAGSRKNNILFRYAHGTGVFLDVQETDPKRRYKLMTKVEYNDKCNYMAVGFSEDGIHFGGLIPWPKYNPAADTHNFVFRDPKTDMFYLYTRIWRNGLRICARSESEDFIHWTEPKEVLRGSGFERQVYSMPVLPYEGIYLGFASMYHAGDADCADFDLVDLELACAANMDDWDFAAPGQHLIERGSGSYPRGAFDCGCIYAAAPIVKEDKVWIYYMGGNGRHTNFRETSFARGFLERDKFAGYVQNNPAKQAQIMTTHFTVYGENICLLADIEEGGCVKAALGTKSGKVYEGYEAKASVLTRGADGYYQIRFPGKTLEELRSKPVSLHLYFEKAKVYAVKGDLENYKLKY
ncbi:MAG: hypothetical protein K2P63_04480 [Lachnospiraceae bacterium]|nr:hypothetical protein [Lachnospiraceae bacterium]